MAVEQVVAKVEAWRTAQRDGVLRYRSLAIVGCANCVSDHTFLR